MTRGPSPLAVAVVLLAATAGTAFPAPRRAEPKGCTAEIGPRPAADLLGECRRIAAIPGACRADLSCEALRAEIRQGCEEAGADASPVCELHIDPDDEEDE